MRESPDTSILGGLTCSVGLHALLGLCFAMWGDGPVAAPNLDVGDDSALVTYLPPPEPLDPPPQPKAPQPPPEPVPEPVPEPPPPEPPPLRLGVDESTANTPAWLGFMEATEHNAPKADIDQSALEFEPGRPGPPGLPGPASTAPQSPLSPPLQPAARPTPPAPADEPEPAPAEPARTPQPSVPPAPVQPATEASESADQATPAEAQEQPTPVRPPEADNEPQPPAEVPAAALPVPSSDQPEGQPSPEGDNLAPGSDVPAGERVDREVGEAKPPEMVVPPAMEALSHKVEVGPLPEGVDRPLQQEQFEPPPSPPPDVPEMVGPPVPESLLPVDPDASQSQPAAAEAAAEPQPEPAAPAPPSAQGGGGGNDGRPGEKADRESDPSSMKPIRLDRWNLGRVLAGEGVNVRTTRPRWSTTTLLTATAPKSPVVRVTFGRNGKVIEAVFVNGQGSGYDNVDEPLLNALHSWTASGKRIRDLPAGDPKAGLTIVFIITLR